MSYCKRCNLKTKQVSLEGYRKVKLPNFGNSLLMWKPFIVIIHNFSLARRIEEEIWTEWSVMITPSGKNIGQHFEKTQGKKEIGKITSDAIWSLELLHLIRPLDYIYREAEIILAHHLFSSDTQVSFLLYLNQ